MLEISQASPADAVQLRPLVERYRSFYKQSPSDKTLEFLTARLSANEAIVFMARENGVAVGFTLLYPTFSTVSLSDVWLLNDLYVEVEMRGKGIAKELMDAAEQAAREASATRVFLRTAHDNKVAQSLYESRGWIQDEVFRRYDLIF